MAGEGFATPGITLDVAVELIRVYADLETRLLGSLVDSLTPGLNDSAPGWTERKIGEARAFRLSLNRLVASLTDGHTATIENVLARYATAARDAAIADLAAAGLPGPPVAFLTRTTVIDRLATQLVTALHAAALGAIEATVAARTVIVADLSTTVATRAITRKQALGEAVTRLHTAGLTAVVDKAGRSWRLDTYADMAIRTAVHETFVADRVATYTAAGASLVIVSDSPHECVSCRPFEHTILSVGESPDLTVIGPGFRYAGTLTAARAAGFLHPGCRHNVNLYTPGLTRPPTGRTADPVGDRARQKLRYHERQVRDGKRRLAVVSRVGDPGTTAKAAQVLANRQAALRAHATNPTVAKTGVRRRPDRERVFRP